MGAVDDPGAGDQAHGDLRQGPALPPQEEGPPLPGGPRSALEAPLHNLRGPLQPPRHHEPQRISSRLWQKSKKLGSSVPILLPSVGHTRNIRRVSALLLPPRLHNVSGNIVLQPLLADASREAG